MKTESFPVRLAQSVKRLSHSNNILVFVSTQLVIIETVRSGVFLNSSSIILLVGKIMAGITKNSTDFLLQTIVMIWPFSVKTTFKN